MKLRASYYYRDILLQSFESEKFVKLNRELLFSIFNILHRHDRFSIRRNVQPFL